MPYTLPPITLTENQTSVVSIPGSLGSVTYLKMVNASPYLLAVNNLLGGSDYMQPGEANVWPVPGLTTSVQVTPQQFGISPSIIPSTVLVVTWYLEGEQPTGNYPVNFNTLSFLGSTVTTNASTPNSVNQDEWVPFVLMGLTSAKDGSVANKLDVASGVAWLRQADQSLGRVAENATSFTTAQINSTYYLDLNPDGTYSWATSHSGQPNYLTIAQVTTDASGNIATVTDERQTSTSLLAAMGSSATLTTPPLAVNGSLLWEGSSIGAGFPTVLGITPSGATVNNQWGILYAGADGRLLIEDETGGKTAMQISPGGQVGLNAAGFSLIAGQPTVGSFGVPFIVAQALGVHVTATTLQTPLSYSVPTNGMYRVSVSFELNNGTNSQIIQCDVQYTSADSGLSNRVWGLTGNGATPLSLFGTGGGSAINNGHWSIAPAVIHAKAGTTINVQYQDPANTPNDFVYAIIERLS